MYLGAAENPRLQQLTSRRSIAILTDVQMDLPIQIAAQDCSEFYHIVRLNRIGAKGSTDLRGASPATVKATVGCT